MITGRSASRSSAAARATSGTGPPAASGSGAGSAGSGASENTTSIGKSMKVGPECGRDRRGSASSMRPGISAVVSAVAANLVSGRTNGHVVELLQRALAPAHRRRAAAEHEHRRAVLLRGGDRAHAVGHAGPRGERRHARLAGDLGPALRGEGGGRLVAHVDEVDALLAAAVEDREQVPARKREELRHAVRLQALGHQPTPVELRGLLGLGAHRPDPIDRCPPPVEAACGTAAGPRTMGS